jgi:hypothetical protein
MSILPEKLIFSKPKCSHTKLFSALANRQLTEALESLESLGIYEDAALLTLAWACYGGIEE